MVIKFTKRGDGKGDMTCVRNDGSFTRGKIVPGFGEDALPHDLLHYIVEKTGGFTNGFFGFVAQGMHIGDSLKPEIFNEYKKNPEAMTAEMLVNTLQGEKAYGSTKEQTWQTWSVLKNQEPSLPHITLAMIDRIRHEAERLREEWNALKEDETLELSFELTEGNDQPKNER